MKDELVICRNCGEVERYAENYMTQLRKNHHNCSKCGNRTYQYKSIRKFVNVMIKKGDKNIIDLINENKYNEKLFGRHKGFDYKKIERSE